MNKIKLTIEELITNQGNDYLYTIYDSGDLPDNLEIVKSAARSVIVAAQNIIEACDAV